MWRLIQGLYRGLEQNVPNAVKELIPSSWRTRVGYYIKVTMGQHAIQRISASSNLMRMLRLDVPVPLGHTRDKVFEYLSGFYLKNSGPNPELVVYLDHACDRFLYTLNLVPQESGKLLEVGAGPYFMTLLLKRFRDYELTLVNYFGESLGTHGLQTAVDLKGNETDFPFDNVDVEFKTLPYPDKSFDVVLLCEVLEHFTNDPLHALIEIRRVLKDQGILVLTTPNVLRVENVSRLLGGYNIYDLYSGYGPQGRHNREYTPDELRKLLKQAGFKVETLFTSDVHGNPAEFFMPAKRYEALLRTPHGLLGAYVFIRASAVGASDIRKPSWLYRSYPADQLV